MDDSEQIPEVQSPLQRDIIFASIVCFISSILFYLDARPAVSQIQGWWVELPVYATVPISVTFFILYHSSWHPENTGAARTCSLLMLSCIILVGEIIAVGVMFFIAVLCVCAIVFCVGAFSNGSGPG
jgi:hypothetical protein